MTRFVELPIVSERGSVIWINPDHVVAVEASHQDGKCWLMTEQGSRTHVDLSQEGAVECLRSDRVYLNGYHDPWDGPDGDAIDLRDSVRGNLTR